MKTKLLKKLRNDAYKNYGIKGFFKTTQGTGVYIIGLRGLQGTTDVASFSLDDAKKELARMRNDYCIGRVAEMRISKYYCL